MSPQLCLNCSKEPAEPSDGLILPLCTECKSKIANPRGVAFEKPQEEPVVESPKSVKRRRKNRRRRAVRRR